MFADDTNIFFKAKTLEALYEIVNTELTKISKWLKLNKLSLNIKKTNNILFKKIIDNKDLYIKIDDVIIDEVERTKFLGVIINSTLTWQDHIKSVCSKVSKNVGKVKNNVKSDVLVTLYHT